MQKTIIALFATACMTGAAFAQTAPATGTDPAAAPMTPATSAMGMGEGGFLTYQDTNQLLGSGLMNANVRGADNENIGTVSDLVLDRDGQIVAVVVGVGGFLGIGQKDVAIAEDQLSFVLASEAAAMTPAEGTAMAPADGTAMAPAATGTATAPAATAQMAPAGTAMAPAGSAGTGTGMSGTVAAGTDEAFGWTGGGIDHIQVAYTRQQLQDAPAFETAE